MLGEEWALLVAKTVSTYCQKLTSEAHDSKRAKDSPEKLARNREFPGVENQRRNAGDEQAEEDERTCREFDGLSAAGASHTGGEFE